MIKAEPVADYKRSIEAATNRIDTALRQKGMKPYARYCAVSDGLIMLLGLTTGYRVSDLLNARRCDIKMLREIPHLVIEKEIKTGKRREIALHQYVCDYIIQQGEILADNFPNVSLDAFDALPIFYNPRTEKHFTRVWVNKRLAMIVPKRLNKGRTISPHSLRKSFALTYYEHSGRDINAVRKLLNHTTTKVTQTYLDLPDEHQTLMVLAATKV
jgi:integrase